ncbi:hypothetical protein LHYA1_G004554 [Lachnellula hyalina]|uniref:Extracellular membrane protein CFEM domain-containing protein n=1 Tax=Lachnellula hyalina TaxID=1316788 RepID=A0A8H8QZX5_9HELO|nr:uncharacterized protein LHYA1_G004554 [Lachnellula hyalina]TVY25793.1 hypothetical protein LHYA1_G004554 [Lachnellula hyalina]
MRASLLFGLLATITTISALDTQCVNSNFEDIVTRTSCGNSDSISKCLKDKVHAFRLEDISPCFTSRGCQRADAVWFMQECIMPDTRQELKKRATTADSTTDSTTTTAAKTTATTAATTSTETSATTTATTATTAASTTASAASSTTSTDSTSGTSTTASSTSTGGTSTTSSASSTSSGSSSSSNSCSVTKFVSTSACSKPSGAKKSTCSSVTMTTSTCAPGLLCFPTYLPSGACMKRDAPLTTSGIVVAIVFGVAITAVIISIIIVSMHARRKAKRAQINAAMVSGSLGKSAADDEGPAPYRIGGASDATPLITPGGGRSEQTQYAGAHQEYFGSRGAGSEAGVSPGSNPTAPTLPIIRTEHSGVGALGQEDSTHWSADYNARR